MQGVTLTSVDGPWPRTLYRNADEFWRNSRGLHHAYTVYRTLRGDYRRMFQPDAVFYVGRSPAAYLKCSRSDQISQSQIASWQRFLWNQTIVPMLVVKLRTRVRIYTAYTQPRDEGSVSQIEAVLDEAADVLELGQIWTAIEAGTIYEEKPDAFQRAGGIDRYLLENLNAAAHVMAETQEGGVTEDNLRFAHRFLTQVLFVCYLIERGMIKGKHFRDELLRKLRPASETQEGYFLRHLFDEAETCAKKRDKLSHLFAHVKRTFNGSLFHKEGLGKEGRRYHDPLIQVLHRFLRGERLSTGQLSLDFWAYDFAIIPIETISAVYESFLGAEGEIKELDDDTDSRRRAGSYYTPPHLAELVVDIALEGVTKPLDKLTILDPACGSGVFLVSVFGRMVDYVRREQDHIRDCFRIEWARTLLELLPRLYGVDINGTACNITCFSLYLALLEQLSPMDVEYLHRHGDKLPPLLADGTANSCNTIHAGNAIRMGPLIPGEGFDIVIGNPPWVSRGNQSDAEFEEWRKEDPNVRGPGKQIAHGFMWKSIDHLSSEGIACLLVPASVFLNGTTNRFQYSWLHSASVERVVNFSDLRFVLFSGPVHPCMAVRFRRGTSSPEATIVYESPKADYRSQQGGPVYIREEDTAHIRTCEILAAAGRSQAHTIWKRHIWGSWRDDRLIRRLSDLPRLGELAGEPGGEKPWVKGQGCQPYGERDAKKKRKVHSPWWDESVRFLDARRDVGFAAMPADFTPVPDKLNRLRRSPDRSLFEGAKVLLAKASRKAIFCPTTVLFRDTFMAIKATGNDDVLRFLSVVLGSDLAFYFLFHTNSNIGIYRPQVYPEEFLSIPFFLPKDTPNPAAAQELVDTIAKVIREFEVKFADGACWGRPEETSRIRGEVLEPLVHRYYGINDYEAMLIQDTIRLAATSCTPKQAMVGIPTLGHVDDGTCQVYGSVLCEMLNYFGHGSRFNVKAEILKGQPYSVVHVALCKTITDDVPVILASGRLSNTLKRMESLLGEVEGHFVFCQSLKVFDGENLYILKPMHMRFWSRTSALNDADEIAGSLLFAKEGG